ncbi:SDR family NAD(P)-dependent oxidoreductase [Altericroceibacterium spongiae]|uniref:SDR family NAD(P)-dependent oxidoreductase n=1 Tax=Altericroceibacterium spongiae TaxID=2320269 RepID=A0A420ES94_9SPHN|nr:SDR family NAD(P)-dependent oxidoreductase [Altericroceibacterium spongiae]RKF23529.1 SDR family NAD(P)-dependent oxidoreductase [Altericroceibacterium spongiae]
MAFDFKGRTAFITGGASGAGFGQAKVFGRLGCKIAIADIRPEAVEKAVAALEDEGIECHGVVLDITDRDAFVDAANEVEEKLGPVTMLFGTAGVSIFGPLEKATYDDYDWIMDVNFNGVVNLMQTFVPRMIKHDKGGYIVNTASLGCFMASSGAGIYSASKFAVHGITMAMRDALKDYGIGVSVLAPANIKSNIAESVKTRPDKYGESGFKVDDREITALHEIYSQGMEPEELARHVKDAIEENRFYIIPYPEARAGLEAIFQQALDALPPADSDKEGQEKRSQAMYKYIEARNRMDKERYGHATR